MNRAEQLKELITNELNKIEQENTELNQKRKELKKQISEVRSLHNKNISLDGRFLLNSIEYFPVEEEPVLLKIKFQELNNQLELIQVREQQLYDLRNNYNKVLNPTKYSI